MLTKIANQSNVMLNKPANGDLNPKNSADHNTFSASCTQKTMNAILISTDDNPCRHTRNKEIDIKRYSVSQTGPKTPSGGVKRGFLRPIYQAAIDFTVKIEPINPAPSQANMLTISFKISLPLTSPAFPSLAPSNSHAIPGKCLHIGSPARRFG